MGSSLGAVPRVCVRRCLQTQRIAVLKVDLPWLIRHKRDRSQTSIRALHRPSARAANRQNRGSADVEVYLSFHLGLPTFASGLRLPVLYARRVDSKVSCHDGHYYWILLSMYLLKSGFPGAAQC